MFRTSLLVAVALVATACSGASSPSSPAPAPARTSGHVVVTYRGKQTAEDTRIRNAGTVDDVADLINDHVRLVRDVTVVVGGDEDGPFYDADDRTIQFPWTFVDGTRDQLTTEDYAGADLRGGIEDAVGFVAAHEVAHALIDQLHLPVLGSEEDAADSFATYVAVRWADDGEQVIAASDLFDAYSAAAGDDQGDDIFIDSHSPDAKRFYTLSCQVYGADPKRYANLVDGLGFDAERLAECGEEWDLLDRSWGTVLHAHALAKRVS